jgi:hypothetical protein
MFEKILEKSGIKFLIDNCPPELLAIIVLIVLVAWLTIIANKFYRKISSSAINERQQRKVEQLISIYPCITKKNATWLQDPTRNGGMPPDEIVCVCSGKEKK